MHNNILWLIVLSFVGLITLTYAFIAFYKFYQYSQLTYTIESTKVDWKIKKTWRGKYYLEGAYEFSVQGKEYYGQTEFTDEYFLNTWAAEQKIFQNKEKTWVIWFQPNKFSHSTLQKKFPTKECGSAVVLIGLLIYFIILGIYTGTVYTKDFY
jgi:hypothetical protein